MVMYAYVPIQPKKSIAKGKEKAVEEEEQDNDEDDKVFI